jgi:hypothetical protein
VRARERERGPRQQPLEDPQGLLEAADPHAKGVERHAGSPVLLAQPSRPDPQLEAATREQVEGCRLLGEQHRMPVVVVEHQSADPQCPGGASGGRQRDHRGELVTEGLAHEVVAQQQRGVAEGLCPTGLGEQSLAGADPFAEHAEPEGSPAVWRLLVVHASNNTARRDRFHSRGGEGRQRVWTP